MTEFYSRKNIPKIFFLTAILSGLILWNSAPSYGDDTVKINIMALNPSPTESMTTTISHHLPPELQKEDIVDPAGMEVKYDIQKKVYYVSKEIELSPKESRTLTIQVKDVWKISDEMIAKTKEQLEKDMTSLKGTKYEGTGALLYEKVMARINAMEEEQGQKIGMRKRIELYRSHEKQFESIQSDVLSIDSLRQLEDEQKSGLRTATFVIAAENPSGEEKKMTIRAPLPNNITADHIVDQKGFALLFDAKENRFVLEKQDVLKGHEKKKYEIVLRDLWYILQSDLDLLKTQTEKLIDHFNGTEFEELSLGHRDFIFKNIADIEQLQDEVKDSSSIKERSSAFVLNKQRLKMVRRKVKELQDLVLEVSPKKESPQPRRTPPEILKLLDVLNRGVIKPKTQTTWWIILGIVVFLGIFSGTFYMTWLSKLNKQKFGTPETKAKEKATK